MANERTPPTRDPARNTEAKAVVVGLTTLVFSGLYFISDLIELVQGGFSTVQLALTLVAEAAIPFFVVGLYVAQRPRIGTLGLVGTIVYAYSFVYFTGTVLFALANGTSNWEALVDKLGVWMTIHGALMVFAGVAFGVAVAKAGVLPRWTGLTLIAGVVLIAVSAGFPRVVQTASAGVRDLAFGGMGAFLVTRWRLLRGGPGAISSRRTFDTRDDRPGGVVG